MCDKVIFDLIKSTRTELYKKALIEMPTCRSKKELCNKLGITENTLTKIEKDYGYPSVTLHSVTFTREPVLGMTGRESKKLSGPALYNKLNEKYGKDISVEIINNEVSNANQRKTLYEKFNLVAPVVEKKAVGRPRTRNIKAGSTEEFVDATVSNLIKNI